MISNFGKRPPDEYAIAMLQWLIVAAAFLMLLGLIGCSQWPNYPRAPLPEVRRTDPPIGLPTEADADPVLQTSLTARRPIKVYPGPDEQTRIMLRDAMKPDSRGQVVLNFEDVDIKDVATVLLGDTLKLNYSIDPQVAGKISIKSPRGFQESDVLPLLESMLAVNDAALVRDDSGLHRVVPKDKLRAMGSPPLASSAPGSARVGYQTRIVPLQYVAAGEIEKILKPLLTDQVSLIVDERRNVLLLLGSSAEIDKLLQTVATFDVDWLAGMSVGLFPVTYARSNDLAAELAAIFGQNAEDGNEGDGPPGGASIRFVPVERLNSILAITAQPRYLEKVEAWIGRLDQAEESDVRRLFVYRVENGKADALAAVLNQMFIQNASAAFQAPGATLAPGLAPADLSSPAPPGAIPPQAAGIISPVPVPVGGAQSQDSIRIIADEANNALVIMATAREYKMLRDAIKQLDLTPLQVFIEANVIEVSLTDDLNYGVEWFFKNGLTTEKEGRGLLDLGGAGLNPLVPGFSYAVVDGASQVRAIVNALAARTNVNVLSSPTLMVLNNQEASINVGDEVPVPTRQSVSNIDPDAPTVNEIQYRTTGVILEVTPRVNRGGLVTMEVIQEVSDVGPPTSAGIAAPTFQQRKVKSTISILSGNTVVLGGLIRDRTSVGESGIPVLSRVPVLGKLFGATTNTGARTELLVMITPRVLEGAEKASAVAEEYRDKLRQVSGGAASMAP